MQEANMLLRISGVLIALVLLLSAIAALGSLSDLR
jgi:hypothetical protein